MRHEMESMHDEIRGLKRQIVDKSSEDLLILEAKVNEIAPLSISAAKRIKNGDV